MLRGNGRRAREKDTPALCGHARTHRPHGPRYIFDNDLKVIQSGAFYNVSRDLRLEIKAASLNCCDMDWLVYDARQLLSVSSYLVCGAPDTARGLDLLVPVPAGLYAPDVRTPVCACGDNKLLVLPVTTGSDGQVVLECVDACTHGYARRGVANSSGQFCDPCTVNHNFPNPEGPNQVDSNCRRCEVGGNPDLPNDPSKCLECSPGTFLNADYGCVTACNLTVNGDSTYHFRSSVTVAGGLVCERCADFVNCNKCEDHASSCTECANNLVLYGGVCRPHTSAASACPWSWIVAGGYEDPLTPGRISGRFCTRPGVGTGCGTTQVLVRDQCKGCALGARPALSGLDTCDIAFPAGQACPAGCSCSYRLPSGLDDSGQQLLVKCDHRTNIAALQHSLPLATADLDLTGLSGDVLGDLRRLLSPAVSVTVRELQRQLTSVNVDSESVGHVTSEKRPTVLRIRLPLLQQVDTQSQIAPILSDPSPAGVSTGSLASCGLFQESATGSGVRLSLGTSGVVCPRGHYAAVEGSCSMCGAGQFYQDEEGKVGFNSDCGCKSCGAGTFTAAPAAGSVGDCQKCPAGTQSETLAGDRACWCLEGHARVDRFGPCLPCGTGLNCTSDIRMLAQGYYWEFASESDRIGYHALYHSLLCQREYECNVSTAVSFQGAMPLAYKCPNKEACSGGLTASCADGFTGTLCAVCAAGFTKLYNDCIECGHHGSSIGIAVGIGVGATLFAAFCWRSNGKAACSVANRVPQSSRWEEANIKLVILIGFVQVISAIGHSFPAVQWPENFLAMTSWLQVLTLDIFALASPACLFPGTHIGFYESLLFSLIFPLVLVVLIGLLYQSRRLPFIPGPVTWAGWQATCIRNTVFVLFLFYPGTSQQVFRMLQPCYDICAFEGQQDCDSYLRSDYAIQCNDKQHRSYVVVTGVLGVALFVIGIPLSMLGVLMRKRGAVRAEQDELEHARAADANPPDAAHQIEAVAEDPGKITDDEVLVAGLSGLFEAYTKHAYLWGVVDMLRKIIITSVVLVITDPDSYTQIIIGVCAAFFFVWLTEHIRPFVAYENHVLQQLADSTIGLNLVFGMSLRALGNEVGERTPEEIASDRQSIGLVLIVVNSILMTITVWQMFAVHWKWMSLKNVWQWFCERVIALRVCMRRSQAQVEVYALPHLAQTPV